MSNNFSVYRHLLGGDTFENLKSSFLQTGRGRRKEIKNVEITNKLLVQVKLLKDEGNKTWEETEHFVTKFTGISTAHRLRYLIERASSSFLKLQTSDEAAEFLEKSVDFEGLGDFCNKAGLTRQSLINESFDYRDSFPHNGLLIELENFRKKQQLPFHQMHSWFTKMTSADIPQPKLKKMLDKTMIALKKMQRNRGKVGGAAALSLFTMTPFVISPPASHSQAMSMPSSSSDQHCLGSGLPSHSSTPPDCSSPSLNAAEANLKLAKRGSELAAARRKTEELESKISALEEENMTLKQDQRDKCSTLSSQDVHLADLAAKLDNEKEKNILLQEEKSALLDERDQLNNELRALKKENLLRRYNRLLKNNKKLQQKYTMQNQQREQLLRKVKCFRFKLRRKEINEEAARRQKAHTEQENSKLRRRVTELEAANEDRRVIRLKDPDTGYFLPNAKLCMMEMVGEHDIAASRCGPIIDVVCRSLLNVSIPESDLPSERSVGRFVDVGHVISKMHVTDAIRNSDHFDLHADGTTKSGKKYVGHQVTVDRGQSLSCGFTVVGTENAKSLVTIAADILEELSLVFEEDEEKRHEIFLECLQKMSGLMSDRAAVMKSYDMQFNDLRKDLLQTEEDLEFLHCNAHFLLGLVTAVDKVFRAMQDDNTPMGRECLAKFSGSKREHPAARFIREACACLGPRGDEKFGCRENWLAYCMLNQMNSEITSFKGNRFNNLFQASAALHFHRQDIMDFLESCMTSLNWKQEGVLAVNKCDTVDNHLVALGLLFFRMTGPYWRLLGQSLHYLHFYTYVVLMQQFLKRWAADPVDAFSTDFEPLFDINMECNNSKIFQSLININNDRKEEVHRILKSLSAGFLDVVNRQLSDFLPGGRYHAVQDPKLYAKLQHSKLTNIVGEQCFGDLDFSMFKRRNASAHYHTSINMLKRNKSISSWFPTLSAEQQTTALSRATSKAKELRKKHLTEEVNAIAVRQEVLAENRTKKAAAEVGRRQKKETIIERLHPHGGPCKTAGDVTELLRAYAKTSDQLLALKAEVQYHKLILGVKSPLLKATQKLPQLAASLKQFLGGEDDQNEPMLEPGRQHEDPQSPKKRRRMSSDSSCSTSSSVSDLMELEDINDKEVANFSFSYKNGRPGMRVVVGYEQDFYLGEIQTIVHENIGIINFMEKCSVKDDAYKWPQVEDQAEVDSKFVIMYDFEMSSRNGRIWTLTDSRSVHTRFNAYKLMYFQ